MLRIELLTLCSHAIDTNIGGEGNDSRKYPALRAIKHPLPPMYPGGMRIGADEEKAVLDVLRSMAAAETRQQLKIEQ